MKCIGSKIKSCAARIREKLKDSKGASEYIRMLYILIIVTFIFSVVIEFGRCYVTSETINECVTDAVIAATTDNSYDAYGGVREGNSSIYTYDGGLNFNEAVVVSDVQAKLVESLGLTQDNPTTLTRYDAEVSEGMHYRISDISITYDNPAYNANAGEKAKFHITYTVRIPAKFIGTIKIPITFHNKTDTEWLPIF